ncbi:N-acetylmuramoyl-L-alanine amidase [Terricaulis sp.]|uniref:N-acetylmuramoyl-L-alanine amidase n=1 Tax=Terricaulis sp. TaxID=2768686 RepID=UPI002AC3E205|nr:N-acetylmuramoyl-L-alanine amidase [Terricaulis sp.]MDZ4692751.1 N-acetylmuramoyl-L-alanine amidase [Terricaulis sp.]
MTRYIERPSPNFDARTRPIDLVVLHYTGMQDAEIALARLTDPAPVAGNYPGPWQSDDAAADAPLPKVSAHYVVDESGQIFTLVPEEHRAWHAGSSAWDGEADVNARSIGIEIVNGGHDFDLPDFPDAQIDAVIGLLRDIFERWPTLNPKRVVAHSDIAPERKADPGEKFPWAKLAEAGVSIWPKNVTEVQPSEDPVTEVQQQLAHIGYDVKQSGVMDNVTRAALIAFQRRFRPSDLSGAADDETRALLRALSHQLG